VLEPGDVSATIREENGEICVVPATRTAGILTQLVKKRWVSSYTSLIELKPRQLKAPKGNELPHSESSYLCKIFFFFFLFTIGG